MGKRVNLARLQPRSSGYTLEGNVCLKCDGDGRFQNGNTCVCRGPKPAGQSQPRRKAAGRGLAEHVARRVGGTQGAPRSRRSRRRRAASKQKQKQKQKQKPVRSRKSVAVRAAVRSVAKESLLGVVMGESGLPPEVRLVLDRHAAPLADAIDVLAAGVVEVTCAGGWVYPVRLMTRLALAVPTVEPKYDRALRVIQAALPSTGTIALALVGQAIKHARNDVNKMFGCSTVEEAAQCLAEILGRLLVDVLASSIEDNWEIVVFLALIV